MAAVGPDPHDKIRVDPADVQEEVGKLLASEVLRNAGQIRCFLHHCVENALLNQADRLKEYAIGVEVFRRGPDFDPRIDPIVRVQARKLRSKLEEYYAGEGRNSRIIIDFAKGAYVPTFRLRTTGGTPQPVSPAPPGPSELSTPDPPPVPIKFTTADAPTATSALVKIAPRIQTGRRWKWAFLTTLLAFVAQGIMYWTPWARSTTGRQGEGMIGLVRLANTSGDPGSASLADHLTAGLSTALGSRGFGTVRLEARPDTLSAQLCTAHNLTSLVRGYVRADGPRTTVKLELYRDPEGYRMWTGTFTSDRGHDPAILSATAVVRMKAVLSDVRQKRVSIAPLDTQTHAETEYGCVGAFLDNDNPGAVWAYGWKDSPAGAFSPYTVREEVPFGGARTVGWSRTGKLPGAESCPYVARNLSGKIALFSPVAALPPDALLLHPGPNGELTVVRWTAPRTGYYAVHARFDAHNYTTTNVYIQHRSRLLGAEVIEGARASHDFHLAHVWFEEGDHLDFGVDYGQNHSFSADSTGLKVIIQFEPPA